MYKPANVTVEIVKTDKGYTWLGNEDEFAAHTQCIIAMYAGHSIGDPESWLKHHQLLTPRRKEAIENLDIVRGELRDIKTVRRLAKILGMTVTVANREKSEHAK